MEQKLSPKTFNFKSIKGISLNQLEQHYKLYEGYVDKVNTIWGEINEQRDFSGENAIYSPYRSLLVAQSFALDGVKLHELYFENMNGEVKGISSFVYEAIMDSFGSYDYFEKLFKNAALAVRGWVVLAYEPIDGKLHIYGQDSHDSGPIWKAYPLLVIDVYEHAYMIDFGIDRKKYIDVFMSNIDWRVVNNRLIALKKMLNC
ncbi:MAG: superoxide dismutase [Clostridium argentinense]|uniref:superoxide dismutase n=1 Tax=Clostridium faecium TaxID=2762223 RepID=A0ABR8YVQ4_9CLOT|nr:MULTISPECIES: superoxide dismutase [Clostridium]MBD8048083.1 superoxide dismutase [Clostridium faecium]MBS5825265.1 superoxide dismutase [Clostridium argentinense]MDU1348184.1 superoxide dismutase [Clostridium argentinense]